MHSELIMVVTALEPSQSMLHKVLYCPSNWLISLISRTELDKSRISDFKICQFWETWRRDYSHH